MSDYYGKVCLNGHTLVEPSQNKGSQFCEQCGASVISLCPHCNAVIKEWHYYGVVASKPKMERPYYCKSCGHPYPWTEAAIEATALMIQEDEELSELECKNLEASLPDLISETPKTQVAVIRVKKALLTAGNFTAEALRQFVIDFGCELAIRSLGLDQSK